MSDEAQEELPDSTRMETAADATAMLMSVVPWVGGPLSYIIGGYVTQRKIRRVKEALDQFAEDLRTFKSEVSEAYVKTDDFQDLADSTLRRLSEEHSEEKRKAYKDFLVHAIKYPGDSYDNQVRMLKALDDLQFDHIRLLHAVVEPPANTDLIMGTRMETLLRRLPGMTPEHISELAEQLNLLGITKISSLTTMVSGSGAENLGHYVTPFGRQFLRYITQ